jgi:hypothetical protein
MTMTVGTGRGISPLLREIRDELRQAAVRIDMRLDDWVAATHERIRGLEAKLDAIEQRLVKLEGTTHHDGKDHSDERATTSDFGNR